MQAAAVNPSEVPQSVCNVELSAAQMSGHCLCCLSYYKENMRVCECERCVDLG